MDEVDALEEQIAMQEYAQMELQSGKFDHDIDRMMADQRHPLTLDEIDNAAHDRFMAHCLSPIED